ncbi:DUF739 family protein [Merdimmobilis hominis]|uniref:DUF739 family protein n=1 Tax=Merdimmobilis hominis TaxID=2897707 RepID=UPI003519004A
MHRKLKARMYSLDMGRKDLVKALGRSRKYISDRMTGKYSWALEDVYRICKLLDIPLAEIPEYFPQGRRAA